MEPLFQVTLECPNCENSFQTSRVRPSFKKAASTDSDFCTHYHGVNPNFYIVRVCPHCGFSSTEHFSKEMTDQQKKHFYAKISSQWVEKDFGGERSLEDALQACKLALISAQIKEEKERIVAGILHHIAWLYRISGQEKLEMKFLGFALDSYIKVYEEEGIQLNNAKLMYLLGELHRRLKNYNEAVKWFSRLVNDKKIMDAAMIRASREQWALTREDMQQDKVKVENAY